jgi:hypothetical protein
MCGACARARARVCVCVYATGARRRPLVFRALTARGADCGAPVRSNFNERRDEWRPRAFV